MPRATCPGARAHTSRPVSRGHGEGLTGHGISAKGHVPLVPRPWPRGQSYERLFICTFVARLRYMAPRPYACPAEPLSPLPGKGHVPRATCHGRGHPIWHDQGMAPVARPYRARASLCSLNTALYMNLRLSLPQRSRGRLSLALVARITMRGLAPTCTPRRQ